MAMLPAAVYFLCFLTSCACLVLLVRGYQRGGSRLLLWTALCFVFLALNSGLVFLDIVIFPQVDLRMVRDATSLIAVATLLFGFIWDSD
jgi:hypothetical protein